MASEQLDQLAESYENRLKEKDEIITQLEAEIHYLEEDLQKLISHASFGEDYQEADRRL